MSSIQLVRSIAFYVLSLDAALWTYYESLQSMQGSGRIYDVFIMRVSIIKTVG